MKDKIEYIINEIAQYISSQGRNHDFGVSPIVLSPEWKTKFLDTLLLK